jgi:hypothetical protein
MHWQLQAQGITLVLAGGRGGLGGSILVHTIGRVVMETADDEVERWRLVLLAGSTFGVGRSENGGGMSYVGVLPLSQDPLYRVRAVGGGRSLAVMELQGASGECPLMTLVLGEGERVRHRFRLGKVRGRRAASPPL